MFAMLGVRNHRNFGTWAYDMAIYDQAFWLVSQGGQTFMTVRGLDVWGHHVNLIAYAFAPFYWLGAGPEFLYVVQNVSIALGALPVYLIAKDRLRHSRWIGLRLRRRLPAVRPDAVHLLDQLPSRGAGDHAVPVRLVLLPAPVARLVLRRSSSSP